MAEYAECPECGNDGPHTEQGEELECGSCYALFPNPFAEES